MTETLIPVTLLGYGPNSSSGPAIVGSISAFPSCKRKTSLGVMYKRAVTLHKVAFCGSNQVPFSQNSQEALLGE